MVRDVAAVDLDLHLTALTEMLVEDVPHREAIEGMVGELRARGARLLAVDRGADGREAPGAAPGEGTGVATGGPTEMTLDQAQVASSTCEGGFDSLAKEAYDSQHRRNQRGLDEEAEEEPLGPMGGPGGT